MWDCVLLHNQSSKRNFIFSYWTPQGWSESYLNFSFIPNLQMTLLWFAFVICIFFLKRPSQRWPRADLKQYKTTREINQMAKNHKSGQAVLNKLQRKASWSCKGKRGLVPLDKPALWLLCRGKLGAHPGLAFFLLHLSQMQELHESCNFGKISIQRRLVWYCFPRWHQSKENHLWEDLCFSCMVIKVEKEEQEEINPTYLHCF